MPPVSIQCRTCGNTLEVTNPVPGEPVNCPHCHRVVPTAGTAGVEASSQHPPGPDVCSPSEGNAEPPAAGVDQPAPVAVAEALAPGEPLAFGDNWMASSGEGGETTPAAPRRLVERPVRRESLLTVYLLAFLIPYSILVTCGAIWLYYKAQQAVYPLEMLPDWPRDNEHPARQSSTYYRVDDSGPLPERLRVALNETVRVGDLEVMPLKVERRPIVYRFGDPDRPAEASAHPALVVRLRVHNVSDQVTFAPNDRFFNRQCKKGFPDASRPYTCLEVGAKRFYGGPCPWRPRRSTERSDDQPQVEGAGYRTELPPGATAELTVCTDPEDPDVLAAVAATDELILWRVQLRRGLVRVRDEAVTATAVVGVVFFKSDIVSD